MDPSKLRAGKNASTIVYQGIPSSIAPVPHSAHLSVPHHPRPLLKTEHTSEDEPSTIKNEECTSECEYHITADDLEENKSYFPKQKDMNNLITNLGLTKSNTELLTSRLKQWDFLDSSV